MAPASRSKSKDKKAVNEPPKGSSKPSGNVNANSGISASGYNPVLGTFHMIEAVPVASAGLHQANGRFRNIDETDDHSGNSIATSTEYDSISNNGSWSGESEEHKEKMPHPPPYQESVPGADNDKREKIRQKNEKKHQRQKEKRAQELHDRCVGYLMSRKLESLAQQLVSMGFSQERATIALMLNEGRVEESVAWLLEGGEEEKHTEHNLDRGGNLKIDISEELACIADMGIRYKASKQEAERVVVACEGDLEKAEETLKAQKQEPSSASPKPEEIGDLPTVVNSKLQVAVSQSATGLQPKPVLSTTLQHRMDEKDFSYTKVSSTIGSSVDPGVKSTQQIRKIQSRLDWAKPQQIAVPTEKRWPGSGSSPPVSYSLASHSQALHPPAKTEARYVSVGNEFKNLQLGSVREPIIMMQRPQSINGKQAPASIASSSPTGTAVGWYPNGVENVKLNGFVPPVTVTRGMSPNGVGSNPLYNQLHYQPQQQFVSSSSSSLDSQGTNRGNGLWSRSGMSPTLAASSLGLFSGLGTNVTSGSSSPVDWKMGSSMSQLDYTSIDWSLDRGSSTLGTGGLWSGVNSLKQNNTRAHNSFTYGVKSAMRPVPSNGSGVPIPGLQDGIVSTETAVGGSREWTSPFEEKDIFSLPRQFVSSPSL
ncbi:uncharacterized protein LOC111376091 isoform X1 [Olea europaea subsp. europaea]|uniref:Uncharacterized protein LOC111376091 isoform X1 n=1 Tax=Olea europaea subsp. europaea TaxID=158383 RepID=A0A8S0UUE9_OLEEU|nr:uncharacterized protein LOC111376091 isoform X1 [Olea europaea subsp. europaea]